MKIDNKRSELETYGDIEEIQTSINKEDLDFIITLLSSNQYSNPERSFLREIVSNAWDSHVAANNTKDPVIVRIKSDYVSIRDYGTGLSKEDFENLYCKIGSSTKRNSNAYIGCFGIGHLSPLACTDTVEIDDYYNGICYHYIMIKDGNKITTTLVGEESTNEHNGLNIRIDTNNSRKFFNNLDQLYFFPNVYLDCSDQSFNNVRIAKYNNYWVVGNTNIIGDALILLGNVTYPINSKFINSDYTYFIKNLYCTGVAFKFEIGELEVTPNREEIIYSEKTINLINERIGDALNEMYNYYNALTTQNFEDLQEYYSALNNLSKYDFFGNTLGGAHRLYGSSDKHNYTYKGKVYNHLDIVRSGEKECIPYDVKAVFTNDKWYIAKVPGKYKWGIRCNNVTFVKIEGRLYQYQKDYIEQNYHNHAIIVVENDDFIDNLFGESKYISDDVKKLWKDYFKENIEVPTIPKPKKGDAPKKIKKSLIHVYNGYYFVETQLFDVDYLNKWKHSGVVILTKKEQSKDLASVISRYGYGVIWASKESIAEIEKQHFTWVMNLSKFYKKKGRQIYLCNNFHNRIDAESISKFIPGINFIQNSINPGIDVPEEFLTEQDKNDCSLIKKYICAFNETYREYTGDSRIHDSDIYYDGSLPLLFWYVFSKRNKLRLRWEKLNQILNDNLVKSCRK